MKLPTPRTPDPASAPALRWGLLGAGWIASQLAISLRGTAQTVVAVGSRDLQRAQGFVDEHVPDARAHGSYADLVADPDVDISITSPPAQNAGPLASISTAPTSGSAVISRARSRTTRRSATKASKARSR